MDLYALFSTAKSQLDIMPEAEVTELHFDRKAEVFTIEETDRVASREFRISGQLDRKAKEAGRNV